MNVEILFFCYMILLVIAVVCEVWLLLNDKTKYLRISYESLKNICEDFNNKECVFESEQFTHEINRFYNQFAQEMPQLRKFYPNVVVWIDAVIFRIDLGRNKTAAILKQYVAALKWARDVLAQENPFSNCGKYHQSILTDMEKLSTPENGLVIQNIINRTEEEFLRLSGEINKNGRLNVVSIGIGVIGIMVSILMAIIKS